MKQPNQPRVLPRWWYLIFFVGAIALFVAGGALLGSWYSHASGCANSYLANIDESWNDYTDCASKKNATYYAALVCLVVAIVFKFIAWTLLIIHCLQRRRYNQYQFAATYQTVPPMDLNQQPYGAYYAPPPGNQYSTQYSPHYPPQAPAYAPAPMYPDTAYNGQKDANPPPSQTPHATAHYA
ncbi:hypothetical protein PEBR_31112 [Penicillium brasilianum]|uniref:Uncharacterized protein n=1 Tax=Penicillium brasilianum TaxID=104259 RepID=A0A1S9RI62_PENBI|nr:hypothetical protein PEBR_31112 [Penicillium brasilianum]